MTAGAAADWMRKILLHWGFQRAQVDRLGTHSCKTTTLSWLSKFGESVEIRSQLGYPQTQGSALIYSRDAMAGPIRRLQFVLAQIRCRRFMPDQSRSGYFVDGGPAPEDGQPSNADIEPEDEISDSEDSADEEDDLEDKTLVEASTDCVAEPWDEHATLESLALETPATLFRNTSTRYIHIIADEAGFRCGREVTPSYFQLAEKPKFCTPQCRQCFR